jgi:hypothetical protein
MQRIKAVEEAIEIVDKAISEMSPAMPAARAFLLEVRQYLEDEQKAAFAEVFEVAA